jgi:hypothetical protein
MVLCPEAGELKAQSLVIRLNAGSENTQMLGSIQKLSFSDGNLLVSKKSGGTDLFDLSAIAKLYFAIETSIPEYCAPETNRINLYPNPAESELTVRNIPPGTSEIFIYRVDGMLVMKIPVSSEKETIRIDNLHKGLYFLVASGFNLKFIKL